MSREDQCSQRASHLAIHETPSGVAPKGRPPPWYQITCADSAHRHDLELKIAETHEEREAAFAIRHAAYCGPGKDLPARPDGLEHDAYDADAILILALLDGVPAGTVRVTFPLDGRFLLETFEEDGAPIIKLPEAVSRGETAEPSRIVVSKERMPKCVYSPHLSIALFHGAYTASRAAGKRFWIFEANERNLRSIRRLGWKIDSLGPPLLHHGQRFEAFWMPLVPSSFCWKLDVQP